MFNYLDWLQVLLVVIMVVPVIDLIFANITQLSTQKKEK